MQSAPPVVIILGSGVGGSISKPRCYTYIDGKAFTSFLGQTTMIWFMDDIPLATTRNKGSEKQQVAGPVGVH